MFFSKNLSFTIDYNGIVQGTEIVEVVNTSAADSVSISTQKVE